MCSPQLEIKLSLSSCHPEAIIDCVIISSQDHWLNSASVDLFTVFSKPISIESLCQEVWF